MIENGYTIKVSIDTLEDANLAEEIKVRIESELEVKAYIPL